MRCDQHTYRECSCRASGVPCRVAPPAIEILKQANNKAASTDALLLALLATIVFALVFFSGLTVGPINV